MIVAALVLLLLAAAAPVADRPLRRVVADPVLPVAVLAAALQAGAQEIPFTITGLDFDYADPWVMPTPRWIALPGRGSALVRSA